jgi:hypothetical protein
MKKIITLLFLTITILAYSQKLEKIKGNKNVILSERIFDEITSIELNKDIELILVKGSENKLEIYADENLHEVVVTDLNNGNLDVSITNRISTKKKFELALYLTNIEKIVLNDNSKLSNNDFFNVENLKIILNNKSDANLFFNAKGEVSIEANDNSKSKMSLKGQNGVFNLQENAKLKSTSNFENVIIISEQKSTITLTGKSENLEVEAKNSSKLKLANLKVNTAKVTTENSSTIYTNVTTNLLVLAEGRSKIYIHGNPKIELESFKGTASLFKKE